MGLITLPVQSFYLANDSDPTGIGALEGEEAMLSTKRGDTFTGSGYAYEPLHFMATDIRRAKHSHRLQLYRLCTYQVYHQGEPSWSRGYAQLTKRGLVLYDPVRCVRMFSWL